MFKTPSKKEDVSLKDLKEILEKILEKLDGLIPKDTVIDNKIKPGPGPTMRYGIGEQWK